MKKLTFTFTQADKKTKILGCIALALALIAIILLISSTSKALYGPMVDLPIVKLVVPEHELDDFEDQYDDFIDELEDAIDDEDDDRLEEFEDDYGMSAEKLLDVMDPLSLNTMRVVASVVSDLTENLIFSGLFFVLMGYAGLLILFVALSALFMNKGFFITSVVLSALFFFVLVGAAMFFVFLALCIAYCILVSKVRTAYILYTHAPAPVAEPIVEEQNA